MTSAPIPADLAFEPSSERARRLDQHMRSRLARSLEYIAGQVAGPYGFDSDRLQRFLDCLRSGPVAPQVFATYCDLVVAIESDRPDEALTLLEQLSAAENHTGGPQVLALGDPAQDEVAARYVRMTNSDPSYPFEFNPPPAQAQAQATQLIADALALLDRAYPELAGEIRALLREIVLAVGPDDSAANDFDGASAFMLWGAILLNARHRTTVLDMVQVLAHESAHNLLFGMSADEALVLNDDDSRYQSPLRADPRPMDGIVHAVYVTARMHHAVVALKQAGVLSPAEALIADAALVQHQQNFWSGMEAVDSHAQFTATGRAIMDAARAYMSGH